MDKIKNSGFFRVISVILIITFISLDIAYAYPPEHNPCNSTLAAPSPLQQQPINEHMARFQQSVFSEGALLASIYDIGDYFFGKPERKMASLPSKYAEEVVKAGIGKILGDSGIEILNIVPVEYLKKTVPEKLSSALSEIGFKRILPDEGVVFILYKKDSKKFLVQIAERAKVSAQNLPGYEWVVSDKYVVKYVPENYSVIARPAEQAEAIPPLHVAKEAPKAAISEPIAEIKALVTGGADLAQAPKRVFVIRAIIASLAFMIIAASSTLAGELTTKDSGVEIFNGLKDFAFAHPIITFGVAVIIGIKLAFMIWRKLSPITYYMNALFPATIFQDKAKAKAALVKIGEEAVPYLEESLKSEDKYDRIMRGKVMEILDEIKGTRMVEKFAAKTETMQPSKATQLFELVESSLNNERTKFIDEGNKLIRSLIVTTGTEALAGIGTIDRNMATAKISQRVVRTMAAINSLDKENVTPDVRATIESLKKNIRQFEADGGVSSLIVLARNAKKENQKLIIGLETDWIPGINVENSLQRQAITALVKEIDGIAEALQSMGLDNVEIIRGSGEKLASALLSEADKTHTNLHNIVVMASTNTINSDSFASLRNADENDRPFLAGIDPAELIKQYEEFGEDSSKQLYIRLAGLIYMTLELAAGKEPPQTPTIVSYDKKLRMVIFLPRAEPMDYEALKDNYKAEKTALQAA